MINKNEIEDYCSCCGELKRVKLKIVNCIDCHSTSITTPNEVSQSGGETPSNLPPLLFFEIQIDPEGNVEVDHK